MSILKERKKWTWVYGILILGSPLSVNNSLQYLSVYRVLINPKNNDDIFNIYVNAYPGSKELKTNFDYRLRFLLGNKILELREELLIKNRFSE